MYSYLSDISCFHFVFNALIPLNVPSPLSSGLSKNVPDNKGERLADWTQKTLTFCSSGILLISYVIQCKDVSEIRSMCKYAYMCPFVYVFSLCMCKACMFMHA
jgi:hypothetical protein